MRTDLPTGTVTFLFTDIVGSTRLLQDLGEDAAPLFATHADVIRAAVSAHGGIEFGTEGDAFFTVFRLASDAIAASVDIQRALAGTDWPEGHPVQVRIGIHTGEGTLGGDNYFGIDVHMAARVANTGHGGQVVLSESTAHGSVGNLPDDVTLRDLGAHRLRDIAEPEDLHDLMIDGLPSDFPPLRAASTRGPTIPTPASSFIGRTMEVDAVARAFDASRLVTCVGPGGIGKSRLAIEVIDRVAARFDRCFFVPLAPVFEVNQVPVVILSELGVAPSSESASEQLPAVLEDKRWFVVLDNFEQIVDAAPLVAEILGRAPDVSILVTSRTPLRITGESVYEVPPLSLPEPGVSLLDSEAVRLFLERAREANPDLHLDDEAMEAIRDIVTALDGLPLAIELAAARTRLMTPVDLRNRLGDMLDMLGTGARDVDERQRTLRGAIAWSYDLLSDSQRALLQDLSVFRGGASLDTIEAACGIDRDYFAWLEDLEALIDQSLVKRLDIGPDSRFIVLEMIREFGSEQLLASGRADGVRANHVAWFVGLAERAAGGLLGLDQRTWLETLERERGNLQEAIHNAMDIGDTDAASRLVYALWRFWHMRGPIAEGAEAADRVLAMDGLTDEQRLHTLEARGGLGWWAGDMEGAAQCYRAALDLAREIGDDTEVVNALYNLGLAKDYHDPGAGTPHLIEALDIAEANDDTLGVAKARWGLANAHQVEQNFRNAHEQLLLAYDGFVAADDAFMTHWTNRELGIVEIELGRLDEARVHLEPALSFFSRSGDLSGTILLLRDHARLRAMEGEHRDAIKLLGAAQNQEAVAGLAVSQFELAAYGVADVAVDVTTEQARDLLEEGRGWSLDEAIAFAERSMVGT